MRVILKKEISNILGARKACFSSGLYRLSEYKQNRQKYGHGLVTHCHIFENGLIKKATYTWTGRLLEYEEAVALR